MKIAVDLDTLIERVYVAPGRQESFRREVCEAMGQCGLDKPVEASSLNEWPTLL